MPGPFPGMDPYLEFHWGDVHTSLTTYTRNQLRPILLPDLRARVEEYVHLESEDDDRQPRFTPDVRVIEQAAGPFPQRQLPERDGIVAAKPVVVPLQDVWTERRVQILDRAGDRLVTTIEFLSPGNKLTESQRARFQGKQRQLLNAGVNLVEIETVREGGWALSVAESQVPLSHLYPYRIVVIRADRPAKAECCAAPLRERLPAIRIPLRPHDPDVVVDLQPLIDAAWEDGDYSHTDYANSVLPQFGADDERWIRERIANWAKQQTPTA